VLSRSFCACWGSYEPYVLHQYDVPDVLPATKETGWKQYKRAALVERTFLLNDQIYVSWACKLASSKLFALLLFRGSLDLLKLERIIPSVFRSFLEFLSPPFNICFFSNMVKGYLCGMWRMDPLLIANG